MHGKMKKVLIALTTALVMAGPSMEALAAPERGKGFLVSARDVQRIGEQARRGQYPQKRNADMLIRIANESWRYGSMASTFGTVRRGGSIYDKHCVKLSSPNTVRMLPIGGNLIFAKALAYNLTGNESYARQVRGLLLELARSSGYNKVSGRVNYSGENQCALDLNLFLPIMIDSAIMLESWSGWSGADKYALQKWLSDVPYKTAAAIARSRKNNWGTTAAFAGWAIGHYLIGTNLMLDETYPVSRRLTPAHARISHMWSQMNMMGNDWRGDSRCSDHGIQSDGGIPNELRRGSTGCDGSYLRTKDSSYNYQLMTISHMVYHAEAVRRHINNELWNYKGSYSSPLIRKAIKFVISNPDVNHTWKLSELGVLRIASHSYPDWAICQELRRSNPYHIREGLYIPFTKLLRPEDDC